MGICVAWFVRLHLCLLGAYVSCHCVDWVVGSFLKGFMGCEPLTTNIVGKHKFIC